MVVLVDFRHLLNFELLPHVSYSYLNLICKDGVKPDFCCCIFCFKRNVHIKSFWIDSGGGGLLAMMWLWRRVERRKKNHQLLFDLIVAHRWNPSESIIFYSFWLDLCVCVYVCNSFSFFLFQSAAAVRLHEGAKN